VSRLVSALVALALVALALFALLAGPARADSRPGSVPSCTSAALKAVRLRITLNVLPAGCRGLTPAGLERAVEAAVGSVADHGPKIARRRLAAVADARLGYLISVAQQGRPRPGTRPRSAASPQAGPAPRLNIPVGAAALVAWLLTAATGGRLLLGWLRQGGSHRSRRPPAVILTHFALATLIQAIPESAPRAVSGGRTVSGGRIASGGPTASTASSDRMPVVTITVHGACATATLLLVLLAAIAAR
jgi:hypothetical protein